MVPGYETTTAAVPWSVLVAHDGVFKVVLLTLLGLPLRSFWAFPFALCGITIVELRGGRVALRAHNLTDHLAPLLEERALAVSEARERTGAL
jgi:broad specificity phosphatase PhoE